MVVGPADVNLAAGMHVLLALQYSGSRVGRSASTKHFLVGAEKWYICERDCAANRQPVATSDMGGRKEVSLAPR